MESKFQKICGIGSYSRHAVKEEVGPLPEHIVIETNSTCVLNCPFCWHHSQHATYPLREMDEIIWTRISELKDLSGVSVCLTTTGEPLLYSRLAEFIELLYKKRANFEIITNGVLLDEPHLRLIAKPGMNFTLMISLDAVDSTVLANIRNCSKKTADRIIKNAAGARMQLDKFNMTNTRLVANVLIVRQNLGKLLDIIYFTAKYGFDEIHFFHPVILYPEIVHYSVISETEQWQAALKQCESFANELGIVIVVPSIDKNSKHESIPPCPLAWSSMWIKADGTIRPCFQERAPNLGNLKDGNIQTIWSGEKYDRFRQQAYSGNPPSHCSRCFMRTEPIGLYTPEIYLMHDDKGLKSFFCT